MNKFLYLAAVIALPCVMSACSELSRKNVGGSATPIPAPDFEVKDLKGNNVSLHSFRGKAVVVTFWATWCPPCLVELPMLQEVASEQDKSKVAFMAVNVDISDAKELRRFLKSEKIALPVYMDIGGAASEKYDVSSLPTLCIIDAQGMLRKKHEGLVPDTFKHDLKQDLSEVLN